MDPGLENNERSKVRKSKNVALDRENRPCSHPGNSKVSGDTTVDKHIRNIRDCGPQLPPRAQKLPPLLARLLVGLLLSLRPNVFFNDVH